MRRSSILSERHGTRPPPDPPAAAPLRGRHYGRLTSSGTHAAANSRDDSRSAGLPGPHPGGRRLPARRPELLRTLSQQLSIEAARTRSWVALVERRTRLTAPARLPQCRNPPPNSPRVVASRAAPRLHLPPVAETPRSSLHAHDTARPSRAPARGAANSPTAPQCPTPCPHPGAVAVLRHGALSCSALLQRLSIEAAQPLIMGGPRRAGRAPHRTPARLPQRRTPPPPLAARLLPCACAAP